MTRAYRYLRHTIVPRAKQQHRGRWFQHNHGVIMTLLYMGITDVHLNELSLPSAKPKKGTRSVCFRV